MTQTKRIPGDAVRRAVLLCSLLGLALEQGCSQGNGEAAPGGAEAPGGHGGGRGDRAAGAPGMGGTPSADTPPAGAGSGGSGGTEPAIPDCLPGRPQQVPAGWVAWTDYSCTTPLWLPPSKDLLPAPIEWEPSPAGLLPGPWPTRRMRLQGPPGPYSVAVAELHVSPDLPPRLLFARDGSEAGAGFDAREPLGLYVVADVDGPVHFAAADTEKTSGGRLAVYVAGVGERHFGLGFRGGAEGGGDFNFSKTQGFALGRVGELGLRLFHRETTGSIYSWDVNDVWIVRSETAGSQTWVYPVDGDGTERRLAYPSSAVASDGGSAPPPVLQGAALFFDTGSLRYAKEVAFTPERGTYDFLRPPPESRRGAFDLGTDGKDLVWTEGIDHEPGEGGYASRVIMTSPYALDPADLRPRRLRSNPNTSNGGTGREFRVGCGYAAQVITDPVPTPLGVYKRGLQLVRLADGVRWHLPGGPDAEPFDVSKVLGLTCEELFFVGSYSVSDPDVGGVKNVFRLRLADLGPGEAPD